MGNENEIFPIGSICRTVKGLEVNCDSNTITLKVGSLVRVTRYGSTFEGRTILKSIYHYDSGREFDPNIWANGYRYWPSNSEPRDKYLERLT